MSRIPSYPDVESREEVHGWFGGMGPDERWDLLESTRLRAAQLGVELDESIYRLPERVLEHHRDGWTPERIAGHLGVTVDEVVDELLAALSCEGLSNRRIAAQLDGRSYKWVERRRRALSADGRLKCSVAA